MEDLSDQIRAGGGGRPRFPYEEEVLQEVVDDPSISVRVFEERKGIPKEQHSTSYFTKS